MDSIILLSIAPEPTLMALNSVHGRSVVASRALFRPRQLLRPLGELAAARLGFEAACCGCKWPLGPQANCNHLKTCGVRSSSRCSRWLSYRIHLGCVSISLRVGLIDWFEWFEWFDWFDWLCGSSGHIIRPANDLDLVGVSLHPCVQRVQCIQCIQFIQ